jgi:hypothetical protein
VIVLLVDANLDGHARWLDLRLNTEAWKEMRDHLGVTFLSLEQAGLLRTAKDNVVWRLCQEHGYYLLTANRNSEDDDSLEATIRAEGTTTSLPVFTFADADRIYKSTEYLDEVAESLLEYLLSADNYCGTGRLYLPRGSFAGHGSLA